AGKNQGGGPGDVGGGHRGADVGGGDREFTGAAGAEGHLVDRPRGDRRTADAGDAAAGGDQVDRAAGQRVGAEAAALGGAADADHVRPGCRLGDATLGDEVAGGGNRDDPGQVGLLQRFVDHRHLLAAGEVEAHVDHVGAVSDGEADAAGDRQGVAASLTVEHPHRHQLGAVGEPGEAEGVVGLLGDRAGDVGAVAVFVERQAIVADEVIAGDELTGPEVGAALEGGPEGAVGDAAVQYRDHLAGA